MNNFEILWNPYCYYSSEPSHLARFMKYGNRYLCGWNTEYNLPIMKHSVSVIKMAEEKDYMLPMWAEIPVEWQNLLVAGKLFFESD